MYLNVRQQRRSCYSGSHSNTLRRWILTTAYVFSALLVPYQSAAESPTAVWTAIGPVSTYSPYTYVDAIAVSRVNPQVLYAGGRAGTGVFASTDAGASWTLSLGEPYGFYTRAIEIDPVSPSIVYSGGYGEIFRSTNAGATWTSLNGVTYPPPGEVRGIAIDPTNHDTIYVGVYLGGIAKTTDAGATWTTMNSGIGPAPVQAVVVDPANSNTIYAAVRGLGIYKSVDAAGSWVRLRLADDPTPRLALSLAIDPQNPSTIYVGDGGEYGSVLKTVDGGTTWTVIGSAISDSVASISSSWADANVVLLDPNDSNNLFVGTSHAGVFSTRDGGATWESLNEGLDNLQVTALALTPDSAKLYAGTFGSGAFVRTLRVADVSPPMISVEISPPANAVGWNKNAVTVAWTVSDAESAIANQTGCNQSTISEETAGLTLNCSATNAEGLTTTRSVEVKIDKTNPVVSFAGNAETYEVDQTVAITCLANDALSGIATTSCPAVASGPAIGFVGTAKSTSTTITAAATDNAGNSVSSSTTFVVIVTADGICSLSASSLKADDICTKVTSIEKATNASAKASKVEAFDHYLVVQGGKSISAEFATLLSRLAHLL